MTDEDRIEACRLQRSPERRDIERLQMKRVQRVEDRFAGVEKIGFVRLVVEIEMPTGRQPRADRGQRIGGAHCMRQEMVSDHEVETAVVGNGESVVVEEMIGARTVDFTYEQLLNLEQRQCGRLAAVQTAECGTNRTEAGADFEHPRRLKRQQ